MTNVYALGPHPRVVLLVIAIIVFVIIVRLCRLRDWMLAAAAPVPADAQDRLIVAA